MQKNSESQNLHSSLHCCCTNKRKLNSTALSYSSTHLDDGVSHLLKSTVPRQDILFFESSFSLPSLLVLRGFGVLQR
ncbi:hypothetical protein F8388_003230 [Cannabis sativa]|uniref:Uncharacterized protein n=1 Tax=Cannabis sativa TaxID=3483 RepID=A0A7J6FPC3_CANSA|nr:hypothetical protein F8388_003230 [Cannabis sativa]